MITRVRASWPVLPALVVFLALAWLFAVRTPLWQVPDEPAHFNYVRALVDFGALPVLTAGDYDQDYLELLKSAKFPPEMSIDPVRYEAHQPPLYYVLTSPVYAATRTLSLRVQVTALRLTTALIGAVLLVLAFALVRALFPSDTLLAFAVPMIVATIPQHIATSTGVENDVMAEVVLTAVLLVLVKAMLRWWPSSAVQTLPAADTHAPTGPFSVGPSATFVLTLGVLLGAALLTKTTAYGAVLLAFVALVLLAWRWRSARLEWRRIGVVAVLALLVAIVISGWWFGRNAMVYGWGDPMALHRHDAVVVGQPRTGALGLSLLSNLSMTVFHSFWVQLGWMAVPAEDAVYGALWVICVLAAVGVLLYTMRVFRNPSVLRGAQKVSLLLLFGAVLVVAGQLGYYNLTFLQPQGRYLFPAIVPLALLFAIGIREIVASRYAPVMFGLLCSAFVLLDLWSVYKYLPFLMR